MKRIFIVFLVFLMIPAMGLAQFKSQSTPPNIGEAIAKPASNVFFGLFNSENFLMRHSFSMSYASIGGNSLLMNTYMNTIDYRISNPLFLRLNLGIMNSPYHTFQNSPYLNDTKFFGGAELMYRPSENMMLKLGINSTPGYMNPYPYYYPGSWNESKDY